MPPLVPFLPQELADPAAPPTVTLPDDPDPIRTPDGVVAIPECGDLLTPAEWRGCLEGGVFTPDDGIGHYATDFFMDHSVAASFDPGAPLPRWARQVVWFNK